MIRTLTAVLGALTLTATAAEPADDAKVRAAIKTLVPDIRIESVAESVVPGLYEVVLPGAVVYVSQDGRYLIQGSVLEVATRTDMTEQARAGVRSKALKEVGSDQRIVFSPAKPAHTVTVFTDIDCGYCRRMHQQISEYNQHGIAVEYLFFPRAGIGSESYDKAVSVWCAADRRQALTRAKAGEDIESKTCSNPIESEFALGQQIGINGTPAIIAADGTQLGGYVPPEQLRQRLDEIALKASP
ncbi:MAG TPA: DsbC family protein [Xanthomonadaceae bacterium]|nr:DsbC family protein [Xanthomonadaceae bacterium]